MRFWEAMKHLEEGKRVRCLDWKEDNILPYASPMKENDGVVHIRIDFDSLLEARWELYEEPARTYTFAEVIAELSAGKKFRRPSWINGHYIKTVSMRKGQIMLMNYVEDKSLGWVPTLQELQATDWIEVK